MKCTSFSISHYSNQQIRMGKMSYKICAVLFIISLKIAIRKQIEIKFSIALHQQEGKL